MMTHVTSIEDTLIVLREVIATQAEVQLVDVINADSIRGAELSRVVNGVIKPYSSKDTCIVFELVENASLDISMENEDESMLDVAAHQLRLVVYGENCRTVIRKLKARMWSQHVLNTLSQAGISISSISDIESSTEFINSVRYLRRDMQIVFVCSMMILPIEQHVEVQVANTNVSNT